MWIVWVDARWLTTLPGTSDVVRAARNGRATETEQQLHMRKICRLCRCTELCYSCILNLCSKAAWRFIPKALRLLHMYSLMLLLLTAG